MTDDGRSDPVSDGVAAATPDHASLPAGEASPPQDGGAPRPLEHQLLETPPRQDPLDQASSLEAERAPGLSALLGFGIAAGACFAFGWLGYQLVTRLGPQPFPAGAEAASATAPPAGSTALPEASPVVGAKSSQGGSGSSPAWTAADQALQQASLSCLARGDSESASPADPSNYGPRLATDWQGRAVPHTPALIVLHETVVGESSALELFRRRHGDDGQQASYHVLIGRDGRRIRVVDDGLRAFGAGDSAFEGRSVQLKPGLRPSINNIALHVSLVSPDDGADGEARRHSGYTAEQYRSLANQIALWQVRWGIPASRVVTHQEVDRSGSRRDPRSFDWVALGRVLRDRWLACGGSAQLADLGRSGGTALPR